MRFEDLGMSGYFSRSRTEDDNSKTITYIPRAKYMVRHNGMEVTNITKHIPTGVIMIMYQGGDIFEVGDENLPFSLGLSLHSHNGLQWIGYE